MLYVGSGLPGLDVRPSGGPRPRTGPFLFSQHEFFYSVYLHEVELWLSVLSSGVFLFVLDHVYDFLFSFFVPLFVGFEVCC